MSEIIVIFKEDLIDDHCACMEIGARWSFDGTDGCARYCQALTGFYVEKPSRPHKLCDCLIANCISRKDRLEDVSSEWVEVDHYTETIFKKGEAQDSDPFRNGTSRDVSHKMIVEFNSSDAINFSVESGVDFGVHTGATAGEVRVESKAVKKETTVMVKPGNTVFMRVTPYYEVSVEIYVNERTLSKKKVKNGYEFEIERETIIDTKITHNFNLTEVIEE